MLFLSSNAAASKARTESWFGRPLEEVLLELRSEGLKIVFSDNIVGPGLTVDERPTESEAGKALLEILKPHGLTAVEGAGGTLVVVRAQGSTAESRGFLSGVVRSSVDGAPVAGAQVRVVDSGARSLSDAEGRWAIADPGTEPAVLAIEASSFLARRLEAAPFSSAVDYSIVAELDPIRVFEERLIVTPSKLSLLQETPSAPLALGRDEIASLPQLGGDFFRALTLFPGTAANDVSAQFHVRGGRRDETQILLDGQELYDAFHLKDRDSAVSFIAPETIGGADLNTGGFPAEYGDRMSGVLDMTTVAPPPNRQYRLGLGVLSASLGASGRSRGDRSGWMLEARRGATDLVGRLLGDEDPLFWDVFGKLDRDLTPRQTLRFNGLATGDELDFQEVVDGELKRFLTEYQSAYAWLTHLRVIGADLVVETAASLAQIDRDRRGLEIEEGAQFDILDRRDTEILDFRQGWDALLAGEHAFEAGWHLRQFETEYEYFSLHEFDNPLAVIRHDVGRNQTALSGEFEDRQTGAYASHRRASSSSTTLEIGARWDRHSLTDEDLVSPRLSVARGVGENGVLRLAWGRYNQSQRTYELGVEDGEHDFKPVERSEHRVVGFETVFDRSPSKESVVARIELYQRAVRNPRQRYENLFEPLNTFPEVEPDRVVIVPERSLAEGVEVFVRSGFGSRVGWWFNYAWSTTEDRVDGRWISRLFDQTHTLNLDIDYRPAARWRVNAAWRYHTGWPTTPVSLRAEEDGEGEVDFVPVLGPLNSERVSDYHRLDLRVTRSWRPRWGAAMLYVDIQNLYDRGNVAGFDIEIDEDEGTLEAVSEAWTGILPSAGIRFEF